VRGSPPRVWALDDLVQLCGLNRAILITNSQPIEDDPEVWLGYCNLNIFESPSIMSIATLMPGFSYSVEVDSLETT
jgi:hypothetical protein